MMVAWKETRWVDLRGQYLAARKETLKAARKDLKRVAGSADRWVANSAKR
jgi:protein tyrosine/serine phosphatase